jgi:hypothetical protein
MVELISNYTIAILALLLTVGFKDLGWGAILAFSVIVIWVAVFDLVAVPAVNFLIIWFGSTLAYALVGWILSERLDSVPFLDPRHGKLVVGSKSNSPWMIFIMYMFFLLLVGIAHIIFELNVDNFPKPAGGFVSLVLVALIYVAFYFLFKGQKTYFGSFEGYKSLSDEQKETSVKHYIRTLTFWLAIIHLVSALTYTLIDWLIDDPASYWNLYALLIIAGLSILAALIAFGRYNY